MSMRIVSRPTTDRTVAWCLILAASLSAPGMADAQWTHWQYQCTPGSLQACGSFSLGTFYDAATDRTRASVGVSNLQGLHQWVPDPGPYVIPRVSFSDIFTTWDGYYLPGSFTLGPGSGIDLVGNGDLDGYYGELFGNTIENTIYVNPQQGPAGIWGCDGAASYVSEPGALSWLPYTCGGTIYHTFDLPGEWRSTESTTASFRGLTWADDGTSNSAGCTVGVDCITVTPEPSTWLMLATGLLAVGIAMRRRRSGELSDAR